MSTLDSLSDIASVVTGVAAIGGLALAVWQVRRNHKIAREATATNLFNQSLLMSLEYPDLAFPQSLHKLAAIDNNRYESFMSSVLLSAEEILSVTDNNIHWRNSIKENLKCHREYFLTRYSSSYPMDSFYGQELVSLVGEIIADRGVVHNA